MTTNNLPPVALGAAFAGHEALRLALAPLTRPAVTGPRSLIGNAPEPGIEAMILIAPDAVPEVGPEVDILAIFGARDPAKSGRMAQLRAARPDAMIALIHGAGTDPAHDRPDLVARAAADFAARRQAVNVSLRDGRYSARPVLGDEA